MTLVPAPEFNLAMTLASGQVFHWVRCGDGFAGAIGSAPVYVEPRGDGLLVNPEVAGLVGRYFALDHPLAEVYATFPSDPALDAALALCRGLRIIRQPLWECLATFITSSLKQVAHIAQISHVLRRRFGDRVGEISGTEIFAYPAPERLAAAEEADLRACGLGYRAKTLLGAARRLVAEGGAPALDRIRALDRPAALRALCEYPGVGTKVANCALLFGYERLDAFPIDVWIERVLREKYFARKRRVTPQRLEAFCAAYFGVYGGYAQQYLFHEARTRGKRPAP